MSIIGNPIILSGGGGFGVKVGTVYGTDNGGYGKIEFDYQGDGNYYLVNTVKPQTSGMSTDPGYREPYVFALMIDGNNNKSSMLYSTGAGNNLHNYDSGTGKITINGGVWYMFYHSTAQKKSATFDLYYSAFPT